MKEIARGGNDNGGLTKEQVDEYRALEVQLKAFDLAPLPIELSGVNGTFDQFTSGARLKPEERFPACFLIEGRGRR